MVNLSADDIDTMVDNRPTVLPQRGQEFREHTLRWQPPAPATRPQSPEPRRRPRTPETHPLGGLEFWGLVTLQKPQAAVPTLREAEAAGNTSDMDVDQQLLGQSPGGDSLPDALLPDIPLPDIPLPDVPLPGARLDGSLGEELTSPRVA